MDNFFSAYCQVARIMIKYQSLLILVVILLLGCTVADQQKQTHTMTRSEIEQFARIEFPSTTRQLEMYTEQGIDRILFLRFVIDSHELKPFLQNSHFAVPLEEGYRPFVNDFGVGLKWWDVNRPQNIAGWEDYQDNINRRIMVDLTKSDETYIYMIVIET